VTAAIAIEERDGGLVFAVRVHPGAGRRCAGGEHQGALKVQTTSPPEKGKANSDVLKILATCLDVRRSQLALVAGEKNRDKRVRLTGLTPEELQEKLEALAADGA